MQWAFLAVILIGLFLISGRYPKLAFSIFGVLIAAVIITLVATSDRVMEASNPIVVDDLVLSNTTVTPAYGGSFRISGRLQNNHGDAELRESVLSVLMLDCPAAGSDSGNDCVPIGQESQRLNTRVPAGQARDFQTNLYFGSPVINGETRWQFEITSAKN